MTWFRLDDNWADSAKVDAISDVAARLWTICGTWCSKKDNLQKFNGYVPRAALMTITKRRWTQEQLDEAITDLVETSKVGGLFEYGLWEPVDGGWLFHNWERYRPRESDEPSLSPSEAASIAGQASAAARKKRDGTAQPKKPAIQSNGSRTSLERQKPFEKTFGRTEPSNESRTLEPPDPDPDPRSDPEVGSQDLTGFPRDASLPPPPPSQGIGRSQSAKPAAAPGVGLAQALDPGLVHLDPPATKPPSAGNLARLPTRRERATDDLMSCPVNELARRCRSNQYDASLTPVGEREELVRVNLAWSQAVGLSPRPLGTYSDGNRPLKTLLDAFEIATEAELLRACEQAARDDWCCGRKGSERDTPRKRDIGCLSQTVLRRLLDACEESRPKFVPARVQAILDEEARKRAGV